METKEAKGILQAHVIFACEKAGLSKAAVKAVEDALDSFTVDGCPVIINLPRSVIKKAERSKSNAD